MSIGQYRIATLDPRRDYRVMSNGRLDESPSFAPNGSMIIYATRVNDKGVLAAVSTDGRGCSSACVCKRATSVNPYGRRITNRIGVVR